MRFLGSTGFRDLKSTLWRSLDVQGLKAARGVLAHGLCAASDCCSRGILTERSAVAVAWHHEPRS